MEKKQKTSDATNRHQESNRNQSNTPETDQPGVQPMRIGMPHPSCSMPPIEHSRKEG